VNILADCKWCYGKLLPFRSFLKIKTFGNLKHKKVNKKFNDQYWAGFICDRRQWWKHIYLFQEPNRNSNCEIEECDKSDLNCKIEEGSDCNSPSGTEEGSNSSLYRCSSKSSGLDNSNNAIDAANNNDCDGIVTGSKDINGNTNGKIIAKSQVKKTSITNGISKNPGSATQKAIANEFTSLEKNKKKNGTEKRVQRSTQVSKNLPGRLIPQYYKTPFYIRNV